MQAHASQAAQQLTGAQTQPAPSVCTVQQTTVQAADGFSAGDVATRSIRRDQNWGIMPFAGGWVGSCIGPVGSQPRAFWPGIWTFEDSAAAHFCHLAGCTSHAHLPLLLLQPSWARSTPPPTCAATERPLACIPTSPTSPGALPVGRVDVGPALQVECVFLVFTLWDYLCANGAASQVLAFGTSPVCTCRMCCLLCNSRSKPLCRVLQPSRPVPQVHCLAGPEQQQQQAEAAAGRAAHAHAQQRQHRV